MFFNPVQRVNWLYLAIALLTAVALWYLVNAKEQVERVVEVRLDYKGLPPGLVVTSGKLNKIDVRLRGPLEMLRSLSSRELSYTIDLSNMAPGSNVIPLYDDSSGTGGLRIYQVVEVMPPRLTLQVDSLLEVRLPVQARPRESPWTSSVRLTDIKLEPAQVLVRGPSEVVSKLQRVVVQVPVDLANEKKLVDDELPVDMPASVEVLPAKVKVQRLMEVQRRVLNLQREVLLDIPDEQMPNVQPQQVSLRVSIPSGAIRDASYLAQIQASASLENAPEPAPPLPGAATQPEKTLELPVKVALPPGARLLRVQPQNVKVSHAER